MKKELKQVNEFVSLKLNNFVKENKLEKEVWFFADFPIFFLPIFLISAWFYYRFKDNNLEKRRDLIYIFFGPFFAIIINLIIQHIVHISRPETFIKPILQHIPDASFPSDHASVSFSFLTALYLFWYKKLFWLFLPFVILMNLSRIAGWIHWFLDVIAWMLIWICSSYLVWKLKDKKIFIKITDLILKIAGLLKL